MPFTNSPDSQTGDNNNNKTAITVVGGRYTLIRCMADTALGKVYWACDQQQSSSTPGQDCNHVLVFTVLPALAQNTVYEQALRQIIPTYRQKHPTEPLIINDGKEGDGTRWLVIQNIRGMLLTERLHELDDRGIPLDETIDILHRLAEAISHHRPNGIFGFLEPGAVLVEENSYCLLNSPLVAALRLANTGIIQRPDKLQTFHSGFISPEVAVGETAEEADDTFSIACIAYNLLQGQAPFGSQSTLEATVRNATPPSINKRKGNVWPALQKGLSLKRHARPATPTALINNLQTPQRPALLIPAIAAGLAVAVAYGSYQILSDLGKPEENTITAEPTSIPANEDTGAGNATLVGEQAPPPLADAESAKATTDQLAAERAKAAEETARIESIKREAEAQAEAELAAADKAANTAQQQEIAQLLKDTEQAIQENRLRSHNPNQPAASDYLARILKLDPENSEAKRLLTQMVNDLHDEAENQIKQQHQDKADELLSTADKIISDFTLTDSLQRQVKLEAQAEQSGHDQARTEQYLERAKHAMDYGNLTEGDDRSDSAVAYLSALFETSPNNADGVSLLKKIVGLQHTQAEAELRRKNTDKARTLLDDSQKLIGEYTLDDLVEAQLDLEKHYRNVTMMGISAAGEPTVTEEKHRPAPEEKPVHPTNTITRATPSPTPPQTAAPVSPAPATQADNAPATEETGSTNTTNQPATPFEQNNNNAMTPSGETPPAAASTEPAPDLASETPASAEIPPDTTPVEAAPVQEVAVPPDVPVTAAVPTGNEIPTNPIELPPIQLDPLPADGTPPVSPEAAIDAPPPDNTGQSPQYDIPVNAGSSFTPGIEGLEEYPLEEIQQNLPPVPANTKSR